MKPILKHIFIIINIINYLMFNWKNYAHSKNTTEEEVYYFCFKQDVFISYLIGKRMHIPGILQKKEGLLLLF
jgi:hypothetical protein